eukprot:391209-Pelagomonas_calceolata.AAC.1
MAAIEAHLFHEGMKGINQVRPVKLTSPTFPKPHLKDILFISSHWKQLIFSSALLQIPDPRGRAIKDPCPTIHNSNSKV